MGAAGRRGARRGAVPRRSGRERGRAPDRPATRRARRSRRSTPSRCVRRRSRSVAERGSGCRPAAAPTQAAQREPEQRRPTAGGALAGGADRAAPAAEGLGRAPLDDPDARAARLREARAREPRPEQARLAIDAIRALVPVLEGVVPQEVIRDFQQLVEPSARLRVRRRRGPPATRRPRPARPPSRRRDGTSGFLPQVRRHQGREH